jgi:multidrug efflux pump subunit AcrB
MFPDESSEEHPDSFRRNQDGSYDDSDDTQSGKGCLIIMAVILILSLLLRYLQ